MPAELRVRHSGQQQWGTSGNCPFSLPLYLLHHSSPVHFQKFSDDSAIVGCISGGDESEYRAIIDNFVTWSELNHTQLNVTKTTQLVVDPKSTKSLVVPVSILGVNVDTVDDNKDLGVHFGNKLDWAQNTKAL